MEKPTINKEGAAFLFGHIKSLTTQAESDVHSGRLELAHHKIIEAQALLSVLAWNRSNCVYRIEAQHEINKARNLRLSRLLDDVWLDRSKNAPNERSN